MERVEEWEEELVQVGLIERSRKGKIGNVMDAATIGNDSGDVGEVGGLARSVYFDVGEGVESTDEIGSIEFRPVYEKSLGNGKAGGGIENLDTGLTIVDGNNSHENLKDESRSSSHSLSSSEVDFENGIAKVEPEPGHAHVNYVYKNKPEVEEIDFEKVLEASEGDRENGIAKLKPVPISFTDKSKSEVEEIDLEKVLEEQDTHDLYCPNCNSCITKRVILRKRKRIIGDSRYDATKREKTEIVQSDQVASPNDIPDNDPSPSSEPDVFRCLSCFSLFIRTVTGFKLFRIFGDRNHTENLEHLQQQIPSTNSNWISSIFESIKGKRTEDDKLQHIEEEPVGPLNPSQYVDRTVAYQKGSILPTKTEFGGGKPDVAVQSNHAGAPFVGYAAARDDAVGHFKEGRIEPGVQVLRESYITSVEQKKDSAREEEKNVLEEYRDSISSVSGAPVLEEFYVESVEQMKDSAGKEEKNVLGDDTYISIPGVMLPDKPPISNGLHLDNATWKTPTDGIHLPVSSTPTKPPSVFFKKTDVKAKKNHAGHDIIQAVDEGTVEPVRLLSNLKVTSQSKENVTVSIGSETSLRTDTHIYVDEKRVEEPRRTREWDVLKSIVYGGLIESIASLGVVSSAAGADATTLNIVALGLANLIGGLFVIVHSLWEVKNDQYGSTDQEGKTDKYQEVLGSRDNYRLHAIVAVLSYILFGLIPPITYGFSFLKSDNKDYKLIAVAAASLLCIVLLSIGKAYVQKAPKAYIKTMLYYVFSGLMASGVSYAVGGLIKMLLERLDWFKLNEVSPVPPFAMIETRWMEAARASY